MPSEWLLKEWIARLNWIASLTEDQRAELRQICQRNGGHVKSGEAFMTAIPIQVCYICAEEFQEAPHAPEVR